MSRKAHRRNRQNFRDNYNYQQNDQTNVVKLEQYRSRPKRISVIPRNLAQENYVAALEDQSKDIIFAVGPAGTGKTLLATQYALKALWDGKISKIVITRPSLPAEGEDLGFLPGDIIEKMLPWARPIIDMLTEYYSPKEIRYLIENETIELTPIAFIRGRTFKDSYIIVDEAQNLTPQTLKAALTRIGEGSRMIVTGDLAQGDRGTKNGLQDFLERFNGSTRIEVCHFTAQEVVRHAVIEEILAVYGED
jgi:phosphate starvation-inducible protein PhoH and related proteins